MIFIDSFKPIQIGSNTCFIKVCMITAYCTEKRAIRDLLHTFWVIWLVQCHVTSNNIIICQVDLIYMSSWSKALLTPLIFQYTWSNGLTSFKLLPTALYSVHHTNTCHHQPHLSYWLHHGWVSSSLVSLSFHARGANVAIIAGYSEVICSYCVHVVPSTAAGPTTLLKVLIWERVWE